MQHSKIFSHQGPFTWLDLVFSEDSDASFRLFSQDPSRYFWMFGCFNGTVHSFDTCINGFVDLLTRDIRPGLSGEINLSGLPWYKILEDIEFTGIKIDDPKVKYIWIGPGRYSSDGMLKPIML